MVEEEKEEEKASADLFALTGTGDVVEEGEGDVISGEGEEAAPGPEVRDPTARRKGIDQCVDMSAGRRKAIPIIGDEGSLAAGRAGAEPQDAAYADPDADADAEQAEASFGDVKPPPPEDEEDPWSEYDVEPDCLSESQRPNAPRMRDRYFGAEARAKFFQRLQFVSKQRKIINWELSQSVDELVFDNEDEQKLDFPFAGEKGYDLSVGDRDYRADGAETSRTDDDLSTLTPDHQGQHHRNYPWKNQNRSSDANASPGPGPVGFGQALSRKLAGKIVGSNASLAAETNGLSSVSGSSYRSAYASEFPEPGAELGIPVSPRTRFINGCVAEHMNPRASLILRKRLGKEINISHMAIGNKIACLLADCLGDMPHITSLNVNNNALTDEGVAVILQAAQSIRGLKVLNISRNKMDDDASDALADFVCDPECQLESLIMQVSDVDDFEGENFVRKLMQNKTITEIDLSDNLLGRAEIMRTVIPDMVTCTEAFADMLSQPDCILKKLVLAWNAIRLQSSMSLARSLRANQSLTHLDISFNAFSTEGGEALGDALMENTSLKYLNIASNGITASACFTISTGIIENQALHRVIMDSNPIGEPGANAIMIVPIQVGSRCKVSLEKCNVAMSDPRCWFSHANPLGYHHLDLSKPYERAVAFAICNLVANHSTYIILNSEYEATKGGPKVDLGLKQVVIKEDAQFFDDRQRTIIAGLQKMKDAAGNKERGLQLFHEADEDGGGSIDADELTALLESVGMDVNDEMIEDIMMIYDIEGQGAIQLPEFLAFLKAQYKEASARLEEMTEMRVMATSAAPDRKYMPPRSGLLHVMVMDGFTRKDKFSVISTCDADYAKQVSQSDSSLMLGFAMNNSKIRFGEAISMFNTMYNDGGQKAYILAKLVVKLANASDAKKLVMKITKGDKMQLNLLKNAMGGAYKVFLGAINGYYELDLRKEMDSIALSRLLEASQTDNTWRMAQSPLSPGQIGDLSQCGTWTNFRNESLNGKRFAITPERFRPMPKSGRLVFDYSSITRPVVNEDLLVVTDARLVKILHNQFLISEHDMPKAMKRLLMWRKHLKRSNTAKGHMMHIYENDKPRGMAIAEAIKSFYEQLDDRPDAISKGAEKESVKVEYKKKKKKEKKADRGKGKKGKGKKGKGKKGRKGKAGESEEGASGEGDGEEEAEDEDEDEDEEEEEGDGDGEGSPEGTGEGGAAGETRAGEEAEGNPDGTAEKAEDDEGDGDEDEDEEDGTEEHLDYGGKKLTEDMAKHRMLLDSPLVSDEAKASRIVELLEETFNTAWIMARHLAMIVESFPCGKSMRTDYFGSYHVNIIVTLFPRVIDVHNFEVVMKQLTPQEAGQVYCRIGWLNVFNPCKPEGFYCLDFCRYEERLVGKMLIALAVVEPGDNWQDKNFRWKWDMDPVPGWELTVGYTKDETCSTKGHLELKYYSGGGKCKDGCAPHATFRRSLFSLVLSSEKMHLTDLDELFAHKHEVSDSDDEEPAHTEAQDDEDKAFASFILPGKEPLLQGQRYLANNPAMWNELFAPPGGCAKQKNPLQLVFTSAYIDDDEGDESRPATAATDAGKGKKKKK